MDSARMATFGTMLRRYRERAGLTQEELAERAQMSVRGLSYLERGARQPYPHTVRRLAEALALAPQEGDALRSAARPEPMPAVLPVSTPSALSGLPLWPTPLIGRTAEVATVAALLQRAEVRLLTLTGPGGVGKTRLALKVAEDLSTIFADGVVFVALAALSDPGLVASTMAQALGLREEGSLPLLASLIEHLREKHLLLVLDNFESVLDAAPVIADVLAVCARVKVLVTSRAALRLTSEHEFAVPPLTVPDPLPQLDLAALTRYDAVALFLQRAQAVKSDFHLTVATAPAVADICRRVDGLPLALELAATRIKLLPPHTLLARLEHRLQILVGGGRDLPTRQQTLRDTIAWSYDILTPSEQALFRRLAVFVGGCTLEAVEAVCNPDGDAAIEVLAGLASLIDNSLLRQEEQEDGEPRLLMLETIQEYALEQLVASGARESLRRQHATYYLTMAEQAATELTGPEQAAWLARLEREHDNLRAALHWTQEADEIAMGLGLAGALWRFWSMRGHLSEGRRWSEDLLARSERSSIRTTSLHAMTLIGAATLAHDQGDYGRAIALYENSLALLQSLGDKRNIARALTSLGIVAQEQGNYGRAVTLYEEGLTLFQEVNDKQGIAVVLTNLGTVAQEQGDYSRAIALYEDSLTLSRAAGDKHHIALVLISLGNVLQEQGDYERAMVLYEDSLTLLQALNDKRNIAIAYFNLAELWRRQGNHGRAVALFEDSLRLYQAVGDKRGIAAALQGCADVARDLDDHAQALRLYRESLGLSQDIGDRLGISGCLEGVASVASLHGEPERAVKLRAAATALRDTLGTPLPPAEHALAERTLERARSALGDDAFTAAWTAGQALSLEQAIALV